MQNRLSEIAKLFLKLGTMGFGGPAVHIALMEEEVVKRRQWMTGQHFLDLVGATNLIPGPNSTELSMHIGRERAGVKGLIVAGCCFIFPAVLITGLLAWLYQQYGQLPNVQPLIYGITPAVLGVLVSLMIGLGQKAVKSIELAIIGIAAAVAVVAGWNEIGVLFGSGVIGIIIYVVRSQHNTLNGVFPFVLLQVLSQPTTDSRLFFIFLKIGSILYGSGYVLFAFLDAELVGRGWLSAQQLSDAIAVGQVTPGPVFSSATFIGWQLGGISGSLSATAGIFLPSFLFVALLNPLIPLLRKSRVMSVFLDTVNVASIAIILAVVIEMGKSALLDWRSIVIGLLGFVVTFFFRKLNTALIIVGGALLGYLLTFF